MKKDPDCTFVVLMLEMGSGGPVCALGQVKTLATRGVCNYGKTPRKNRLEMRSLFDNLVGQLLRLTFIVMAGVRHPCQQLLRK